MTHFAFTTALLSLAIFGGFILLGVRKFGMLPSYSAYSSKWAETVPIHNANLWSIITTVVALLLAPVLIEQGEGNPWQCLGFFAPLYLIVVAFTPRWETDEKQKRVHVVGAVLCAVLAVLWIILLRHQWWPFPLSLLAAWCVAHSTDTVRESSVFWLEMTLFTSVYIALLS